MSTLKENVQFIQTEKNSKILPENIKEGVTIFDVTGTHKEYNEIGLPAKIKNINGLVQVQMNAKNVFNIKTTPTWNGQNTAYSVSGNVLTVSGTWYVGFLVDVEPNTNYYINYDAEIITDVDRAGDVKVWKTDKTTEIRSGKGIFSTNETRVYILFYSGGEDEGLVKFSNIQLEKGTRPSAYEPYTVMTLTNNRNAKIPLTEVQSVVITSDAEGEIITASDLTVTPSTEEQVFDGLYNSVIVNGVDTSELVASVSTTFNDTSAKIYSEIQAKYDSMTPRVLTNDDKKIDKTIMVVPTKSDGTPLIDTSGISSMYSLFYSAKIKTIPVLSTMSCTSTQNMFHSCYELTHIPLLDTSKVTNMSYMFTYCSKLTTIPVLNTSLVTTMTDMFDGCSSLSDDSLNNVLQMCINTTSAYKGTKTLNAIGIKSAQATKCTTLLNYDAFIAAGWTTGY